jgi:hypothetical protein
MTTEELIQMIERLMGQLTDAQLHHIMSMCEVEYVNRMAADSGYTEE